MTQILRFHDLKARGIVRNWPQLRRMQLLYGFPTGFLLTPNVRGWVEAEVDQWIAARPREISVRLKGGAKVRHARKLAASGSMPGATEPPKAAPGITAAGEEPVEPAE